MKKLLVLMLVLSLASAANALVLSLNGEIGAGNDMVEEITVAPSDLFIIDVHSLDGVVDQFWVEIIGPAEYTGWGTVYTPPAPGTLVADDGGYGVGWIHGYMPTASATADTGKWWELELHCTGPEDVLVNLYDSTGYVIVDTAVIHQVPEPMTIALLGLGGLLLRRRKA